MTTERNAALVRRVSEEIWNEGDLDLTDVLFAPTYVNHLGVIPDLMRGPEAIKFSVVLYRTAFPQLHVRVDDLSTDGDTLVLRWTALSQAPGARTGSARVETLTRTTLSHLVRNQIVESWTSWNAASVLERLGVLAPRVSPGQPGRAGGGPPYGHRSSPLGGGAR